MDGREIVRVIMTAAPVALVTRSANGTSDWKTEVSQVTLVGDDDGDTVDGELLVHSALGSLVAYLWRGRLQLLE